tara:strand:+ start:7128 stop:8102 length:975 start_codon:yes stop_codon:yes gene_type:complete
MSKLSFEDLVNTLREKYKYKFDVLTINSLGDYKPEDSDWNYKDVPHLNIVHQNVDSVQAYISDNVAGAINTQKIPFFGFKFPMTLLNYEFKKHNQVYFSTLGPYLIIVNTISSEENGKTVVKTSYAIGSRGFFSFFHWVIKKAIRKNYKVLMSEDIPMRDRKGLLRKFEHDFYKPEETYSFKFTEEIYRANTYIKSTKIPKVTLNICEIYNSNVDNIYGEKDGLMSFFATKENGKVKLWPRTCPHEGAKLNGSCINRKRLLCPWHHRRISHLIEIDKNHEYKLIPSIDYAVSIDKKNSNIISIVYRNNPEYYNTKPYEIFRQDD